MNQTFVRDSNRNGVQITPVNFNNPTEAGYKINNWVAAATKNKIQNIFKPESSVGTRLLLANTLYFRGLWKHSFNESDVERFYTSARLMKYAPFMRKHELMRSGECQTRNGNGKGKWVEIPYEVNVVLF